MVVWTGQIKCGGCGTVSDKETSVTPSELYDIPKSKGSANLVQKVILYWPSMGLCKNDALFFHEVCMVTCFETSF